jgi:hypothetical protein
MPVMYAGEVPVRAGRINTSLNRIQFLTLVQRKNSGLTLVDRKKVRHRRLLIVIVGEEMYFG